MAGSVTSSPNSNGQTSTKPAGVGKSPDGLLDAASNQGQSPVIAPPQAPLAGEASPNAASNQGGSPVGSLNSAGIAPASEQQSPFQKKPDVNSQNGSPQNLQEPKIIKRKKKVIDELEAQILKFNQEAAATEQQEEKMLILEKARRRKAKDQEIEAELNGQNIENNNLNPEDKASISVEVRKSPEEEIINVAKKEKEFGEIKLSSAEDKQHGVVKISRDSKALGYKPGQMNHPKQFVGIIANTTESTKSLKAVVAVCDKNGYPLHYHKNSNQFIRIKYELVPNENAKDNDDKFILKTSLVVTDKKTHKDRELKLSEILQLDKRSRESIVSMKVKIMIDGHNLEDEELPSLENLVGRGDANSYSQDKNSRLDLQIRAEALRNIGEDIGDSKEVRNLAKNKLHDLKLQVAMEVFGLKPEEKQDPYFSILDKFNKNEGDIKDRTEAYLKINKKLLEKEQKEKLDNNIKSIRDSYKEEIQQEASLRNDYLKELKKDENNQDPSQKYKIDDNNLNPAQIYKTALISGMKNKADFNIETGFDDKRIKKGKEKGNQYVIDESYDFTIKTQSKTTDSEELRKLKIEHAVFLKFADLDMKSFNKDNKINDKRNVNAFVRSNALERAIDCEEEIIRKGGIPSSIGFYDFSKQERLEIEKKFQIEKNKLETDLTAEALFHLQKNEQHKDFAAEQLKILGYIDSDLGTNSRHQKIIENYAKEIIQQKDDFLRLVDKESKKYGVKTHLKEDKNEVSQTILKRKENEINKTKSGPFYLSEEEQKKGKNEVTKDVVKIKKQALKLLEGEGFDKKFINDKTAHDILTKFNEDESPKPSKDEEEAYKLKNQTTSQKILATLKGHGAVQENDKNRKVKISENFHLDVAYAKKAYEDLYKKEKEKEPKNDIDIPEGDNKNNDGNNTKSTLGISNITPVNNTTMFPLQPNTPDQADAAHIEVTIGPETVHEQESKDKVSESHQATPLPQAIKTDIPGTKPTTPKASVSHKLTGQGLSA